jgi:hypothetical protein
MSVADGKVAENRLNAFNFLATARGNGAVALKWLPGGSPTGAISVSIESKRSFILDLTRFFLDANRSPLRLKPL